jgi:hypothetical protein
MTVVYSRFCAACQKIFEGNPEQEVEQPHHKSLEDFQAAKDGGCHLCNLLSPPIGSDARNALKSLQQLYRRGFSFQIHHHLLVMEFFAML